MKDKDSVTQHIPIIDISDENKDVSDVVEEKVLDNSVVKVVFKDEQFFKKYKSKIELFLKELLEEEENFSTEHEFEKLDQSFHIDKVYHADNESSIEKSVPVYSTAYEDVLHCPEEKVEEKSEENNKPQAMTCFNCRGDHHMKDCPEKIDRQRIANNKKDLMPANTSRYHEEERKNAIRPGCPSVELRNALGLRQDQLPRYIYSMRVIGYPPGWMQEAVHETSGLFLYDDSERNSPAENDSTNFLNNKTQYDSEKFVNYPGFNSPVPLGFRDEWQTLGWLPIQKHQQLSEALKSDTTISSKNVSKRKHLPSTSSEEIKKSKSGTKDDNESNSRWSPEHSSTPKHKKSDSQLNQNNFESPASQNSHSLSLSKSPGTPVVNHGNPFCKLPAADKFSQDITEHMPFENLPDAVGKFENMRNVLTNVQRKLQDLSRS